MPALPVIQSTVSQALKETMINGTI